jgi:hypothetical protein
MAARSSLRDTRRSTADQPRRAAARSAYVVIVRGLDGRPRLERFRNAASFHARVAALTPRPEADAVTIDELADLLDQPPD